MPRGIVELIPYDCLHDAPFECRDGTDIRDDSRQIHPLIELLVCREMGFPAQKSPRSELRGLGCLFAGFGGEGPPGEDLYLRLDLTPTFTTWFVMIGALPSAWDTHETRRHR